MAKLSKRQKAINEKVEAGKIYPISEAVELLKELSSVKFEEGVDVSVNLGRASARQARSGRARTIHRMGLRSEI